MNVWHLNSRSFEDRSLCHPIGHPTRGPQAKHCHRPTQDSLNGGIAAGFEVRVQAEAIDVFAEISPIMRNPDIGALVDFIGLVRNNGDTDDVVALNLEHYPGMTKHSLWGIVEETCAR